MRSKTCTILRQMVKMDVSQSEDEQELFPSRLSDRLQDYSVAFSSVEETQHPIEIKVSGTVPQYLHNLVYYRNGPGRFELKHSCGEFWRASHWFDAMALVASFKFDAITATVTFRSRETSTDVVNEIENTPKKNYVFLSLQKEVPSLWRQILNFRKPRLHCSSGMPGIPFSVSFDDIPGMGLVARTDIAACQCIDEHSLVPGRTLRFNAIDKRLSGWGAMAHGMTDTITGEYFNVNWGFNVFDVKYTFFKVNPDASVKILGHVNRPGCYIHSAALTSKYFIYVLTPTKVNIVSAALSNSFVDSISVTKDSPVQFVVVARDGRGVIAEFEHPLFFFFHVINSYDDGNDIVIDILTYNDIDVIHSMALERLRKGIAIPIAKFSRFVLSKVCSGDAANKKVATKSEISFKSEIEMPTVSPLFSGKPYRYLYGPAISKGQHRGVVCKLDIHSGHESTFANPGCFYEEVQFVPNPSGTSEDDGVLLILELNTLTRKSTLVILNAQSFCEIGRAQLPTFLPTGFHGCIRKLDE